MKLSSLQTLAFVLATATLATAARSVSSTLPLQAREEADSVSVSSASTAGPTDGEYVILSDEGVEQASVVVHKGAVAASEEDSLRKLYTWLGAYFARRDHASEAPVLPGKAANHPPHAVVYKQQAVPSYNQQALHPYHGHAVPESYNRAAAVPSSYGQNYGPAYGQSQRPFNNQQSYRPKPQYGAYPYSNPGFNTNPGYNGSPSYNGNAGFSSPGYNTNPGYNGYSGYGSSPYSAYASYGAYPYAAYAYNAYNAYLQRLRSAMANYGALASAQPSPSYVGATSHGAGPSSAGAHHAAHAQDAHAPGFNGFTSSLPVSVESAQDDQSLPGFAAYPPDSLAALVSPLTAAQRRAELNKLETQHKLQQGGVAVDSEVDGAEMNLQEQFEAQQLKMQQELELQEKALQAQREYHAQQEKLRDDLELEKKALKVQREYFEQQEALRRDVEEQKKALQAQRDFEEQQAQLKALHEAQALKDAAKAKGDAVESVDRVEAPEYDEVEAESDIHAPTQGKSFLYGAYRDA